MFSLNKVTLLYNSQIVYVLYKIYSFMTTWPYPIYM